MYPRSTSVNASWTRTRSPTLLRSKPRTSFPSIVGWTMRTHVPFSDAPVTVASNRSPILDELSAGRHLQRHVVFARGVTLFQIAIAVGAISALTNRRAFWFVSLVFGLAGIVFLLQGWLAG